MFFLQFLYLFVFCVLITHLLRHPSPLPSFTQKKHIHFTTLITNKNHTNFFKNTSLKISSRLTNSIYTSFTIKKTPNFNTSQNHTTSSSPVKYVIGGPFYGILCFLVLRKNSSHGWPGQLRWPWNCLPKTKRRMPKMPANKVPKFFGKFPTGVIHF